jgi:hypothetical protein
MLSTAYQAICEVDEYAEYGSIAVGELVVFQGFAVPTGTIYFAYSFQSDNLLGDVIHSIPRRLSCWSITSITSSSYASCAQARLAKT